MGSHENSVEEAANSIGVAVSYQGIHSQRAELSNYQPVQEHCLAERGGKDLLLHSGKEVDQLPHGKWIHQQKLPEGQNPRINRRY